MKRIAILAGAALAVLTAGAPAFADDSMVVICKVITDRATELIQTGEIAKARAMKPQLENCIRQQRADQEKAARQLVKQYDEAVRSKVNSGTP